VSSFWPEAVAYARTRPAIAHPLGRIEGVVAAMVQVCAYWREWQKTQGLAPDNRGKVRVASRDEDIAQSVLLGMVSSCESEAGARARWSAAPRRSASEILARQKIGILHYFVQCSRIFITPQNEF
jgi:hypothetical protein